MTIPTTTVETVRMNSGSIGPKIFTLFLTLDIQTMPASAVGACRIPTVGFGDNLESEAMLYVTIGTNTAALTKAA